MLYCIYCWIAVKLKLTIQRSKIEGPTRKLAWVTNTQWGCGFQQGRWQRAMCLFFCSLELLILPWASSTLEVWTSKTEVDAIVCVRGGLCDDSSAKEFIQYVEFGQNVELSGWKVRNKSRHEGIWCCPSLRGREGDHLPGQIVIMGPGQKRALVGFIHLCVSPKRLHDDKSPFPAVSGVPGLLKADIFLRFKADLHGWVHWPKKPCQGNWLIQRQL